MILLDPSGDRIREDLVIVRAAEAPGIDVLRLGAATRAADHVRCDLRDVDRGARGAGLAEVQLEIGIPDLEGHMDGRIWPLTLRADQEAIAPCSLRPTAEEEPGREGTPEEEEPEPSRSGQASEEPEQALKRTAGQGTRLSEAKPSSCSAEPEEPERKNHHLPLVQVRLMAVKWAVWESALCSPLAYC